MTNEAIYEIQELSHKAQQLAQGNASQRAESQVLLKRITSIEKTGQSSREMRLGYATVLNSQLNPQRIEFERRYLPAFDKYLFGGAERELRDLLVGAPEFTTAYSTGVQGGYLIPMQYRNQVFEAMAQTDPLLSADVCDFVQLPTPTLQPEILNGYDLSSITSALIGEATQQTAGTAPNIAGRTLRNNLIYKISLASSIEAEQDIPNLGAKLMRAYGVAMARKLGADAVNGNGTTQPQGIFTALTSSYSTQNSGKIVYNDITAIFFLLNAFYRSQPKCGWILGDQAYARVRNAVDTAGRPLLDLSKDKMELLSKPCYISPTLGLYIIFGDLDHFHIRCAAPTLQRTTQQGISDVTKGELLYVGRTRMDSAYFDPSNGTAAPCVLATVTP